MSTSIRTPKVTKADLARAVELIEALGLTPGTIEVEPGRVRIIAGDQRVTLSNDGDDLSDELAKFRAGHGYS